MMYQYFYMTHIACVVLSGALFAGRLLLLKTRPQQPLAKILKILPHIVDTVLLTAAIGMLFAISMNPLQAPWLIAKIVALFAYIMLGAMCMRASPGSGRQSILFVASITVYAYIVVVAISKQWLPL